MRANREYRLVVARDGSGLRGDGSFDSVEVVEVASGESVLFWDFPVAISRRLIGMLKADLAQLDADEFLGRWAAFDPDDATRA